MITELHFDLCIRIWCLPWEQFVLSSAPKAIPFTPASLSSCRSPTFHKLLSSHPLVCCLGLPFPSCWIDLLILSLAVLLLTRWKQFWMPSLERSWTHCRRKWNNSKKHFLYLNSLKKKRRKRRVREPQVLRREAGLQCRTSQPWSVAMGMMPNLSYSLAGCLILKPSVSRGMTGSNTLHLWRAAVQ